MVAVIRSSRSAKRCCEYNEKKAEQGAASCIMPGNYPADPWELSRRERMLVLQRRMALNARSKRSALHIVLSFHPDDKLSTKQLSKICERYMDQIGLGQQPYLVYQHLDTLHPHLHIVTVTIKADGAGMQAFPTRIAISKNVRVSIENDFKLTPAAGQVATRQHHKSAQRLQYGKVHTAQGISAVLSVVLPHFKYGSLLELNAVLRHYNVIAKRGGPDSQTYQNQGLYYQMISEKGKTMGVPVKASSLPSRPTLSYLQKRFEENRALSATTQQRLKTLIGLALIGQDQPSFWGLQGRLASEGVQTVFGYDQSGQLRQIIFVDFTSRSVISASRLGERYIPSKILQPFGPAAYAAAQQQGGQTLDSELPVGTRSGHDIPVEKSAPYGKTEQEGFLSLLLQPASPEGLLPYELRKPAKKKRRQLSLLL